LPFHFVYLLIKTASVKTSAPPILSSLSYFHFANQTVPVYSAPASWMHLASWLKPCLLAHMSYSALESLQCHFPFHSTHDQPCNFFIYFFILLS
jgi:hypothetical protein